MNYPSPKQLELESLEHLYTKMIEEDASKLSLDELAQKITKLKTEVNVPQGKQLLQG